MRNRSQAQSQLFLYILAAIILSLIFIFGYRTIQNQSKDTDNVLEIQFIEDVKNTVDTVRQTYRSLKVKTFESPKEYSEICFSDTNEKSLIPLDFIKSYKGLNEVT